MLSVARLRLSESLTAAAGLASGQVLLRKAPQGEGNTLVFI